MVGAREKKGKECELMMMDGGDELNGDPSNFPYRVSDWDRVCVNCKGYNTDNTRLSTTCCSTLLLFLPIS